MLERKTLNMVEPHESFDNFPVGEKSCEEPCSNYSMANVFTGDTYIPVQNPQYVCTDCGKKYKWQDSLRRHQRVDCGNKEKRFSCVKCDRKFKYRYELRNHIFAMHGP
ncbi:longitudinals lacking protein-like [Orussus abietinus]|uniref:longitudinals lacking protein-like n=1 Tax=Orussus abietinus TaxID=222816 RepID=UPI0006262CD0|nr:longitudinals lacking protein-like [Orussus abietinus]